MSNENSDRKQDNKNEQEGSIKPEPETLHTTDPQEHMEGPLSSLMHKTGDSLDTNESKEEADREKEKDM